MYSENVTVLNKYGIHARPSAAIVLEASKYTSEIKITNLTDGAEANARSVLNLLLLNAPYGTELKIEATGTDEVEAVIGLVKTIRDLPSTVEIENKKEDKSLDSTDIK